MNASGTGSRDGFSSAGRCHGRAHSARALGGGGPCSAAPAGRSGAAGAAGCEGSSTSRPAAFTAATRSCRRWWSATSSDGNATTSYTRAPPVSSVCTVQTCGPNLTVML